jgi:hypothetical protein
MDNEAKEKVTMSTRSALKEYLDKALTTVAQAKDLLTLAEEAYTRSRDAKNRGEEDEARAEGTDYLNQAKKVFLGE